ncbi:MAG: TatD family hydrolase [Dysgonamonadaceae bacterium]|nr:TatD family hydrolase [Dysgonamonadaceae bacterium]MDD4728029.1 TatD family hydrolase [Dysgonamonadaceae bacterium]
MLIDTHAHLYSKDYNDDLLLVIENAKHNNVGKVLLPNIDLSTIEPLKKIVRNNPDFFLPMMGLHPTSVKSDYKSQLDTIYCELFSNEEYVAVGEIGIDLYWDKTHIREQIEAFETQLKWSIEKGLPLSIHSRNSYKEICESLNRVGGEKLRGTFHSFSGTSSELKELMQFENFYFGINGVVTFKNSTLREVLKDCPIERIVLETDSPYLTPVPYRGKRNEPQYLKFILQALSGVYNLKPEDITRITKSNSVRLFDLNI